jgi:hypothetical protein
VPPATGTVQVLLPATQSKGAWTSTPFTVGGAWSIGWAYQCTPAPASGPAFEVFVVPTGGTPGSTPAVTAAAASGSSVTAQSTTGSLQLEVQAQSTCIWAVKATGIG